MINKYTDKDAQIFIYDKLINMCEEKLKENITEHNKQKIINAYNEVMGTLGDDAKSNYPIENFIDPSTKERRPLDVIEGDIESSEKVINILRDLQGQVK